MEKQLYKVFKVYKLTERKVTLRKNLTLEEAKRVVQSYPHREKSMVCLTKQKPFISHKPADGTYEEGQLMTKAIKMNDPNWRQ